MMTFYILSVLNILPCSVNLIHHSQALTYELISACFLLDSSCSWVNCRIVFAIELFMPVQDIKRKRLFELPIASPINIFYLYRIRFNSAHPIAGFIMNTVSGIIKILRSLLFGCLHSICLNTNLSRYGSMVFLFESNSASR